MFLLDNNNTECHEWPAGDFDRDAISQALNRRFSLSLAHRPRRPGYQSDCDLNEIFNFFQLRNFGRTGRERAIGNRLLTWNLLLLLPGRAPVNPATDPSPNKAKKKKDELRAIPGTLIGATASNQVLLLLRECRQLQ